MGGKIFAEFFDAHPVYPTRAVVLLYALIRFIQITALKDSFQHGHSPFGWWLMVLFSGIPFQYRRSVILFMFRTIILTPAPFAGFSAFLPGQGIIHLLPSRLVQPFTAR